MDTVETVYIYIKVQSSDGGINKISYIKAENQDIAAPFRSCNSSQRNKYNLFTLNSPYSAMSK